MSITGYKLVIGTVDNLNDSVGTDLASWQPLGPPVINAQGQLVQTMVQGAPDGGGGGGGGVQPGDPQYVMNHYEQTLANAVATTLGPYTVALLDVGFGVVNMLTTQPGLVNAATPAVYIDIGDTTDVLWWSPINDSNLQGAVFPPTTTVIADTSRGISYPGVAVTGNATLSNQTAHFTIVNNVITSIALSTPL